MKKDYSLNYIKNALFQILATIVGMLSLFIVVPFLSENKTLFGIYSVCVSLNIFFNYADMGFLSSGQKYAGEFYAQNDLRSEERIVSFTLFVLLSFVLLLCICLAPLVLMPEILITELNPDNKTIASGLILTLILSAPIIAIKRVFLISYACRIEQYKYQRVTLIGHIIKILSVLYFFRDGYYEILYYFIFLQLVDLICTLYLCFYVIKKYDYNTYYFLSSFKFDLELWRLVKQLVGASLISTISWILYYELDLMVLARLTSPEILAVYSTAFTLLSFSRNYFAVIYSSFAARYNHYVGLGDYKGLTSFFERNIILLFPITFFPIIIFIILGEPFVISWVGNGYEDSVYLAKILYLGSLLAFLSYPSGQYLFAADKIKYIYVSALILPILFWFGIIFSYGAWGVIAFAIFKAISQLISASYSFLVSSKDMRLSIKGLFILLGKQYFVPFILVLCICYYIIQYMMYVKSTEALVINIGIFGIVFLISLISSMVSSTSFREYAFGILRKFIG